VRWACPGLRPGVPLAGIGFGGRRGSGLGGLAGFVGQAALFVLGGLTHSLLGSLAGFFLAPAGFLGGGEDGYRLLLAPFGLAPGGIALLFDQRALAGGLLRRGQRAGRGALRPTGGRRGRGAHLRRGRRGAGGRRRTCWLARRGLTGQRGAFLAHLDLHHLGAAVAEALPDLSRVNGTAAFQPPHRPKRQTPLVRVLIVRLAHASRTPCWRISAGSFLSSATLSCAAGSGASPASRMHSMPIRSANAPGATTTCTV
jgi:hypothetical protein